MEWKPLISDAKEAFKIEQVIYKIANGLGKSTHNDFNRPTDPSLMYGRFGHSLLYGYLYQYSNAPELYNDFLVSVEGALALVADNEPELNFGRGYSGYAWCLQHLVMAGFLDADMDELTGDITTQLYGFSDHLLSRGEYDYLLGGLGPSIFLLERAGTGHLDLYLEQVVNLLHTLAVSTRDRDFLWLQIIHDGPNRINLGIAHGIPGLLVILSKCYRLGVQKDKCLELINGGLSFLSNSRFPDGKCSFPFSISIEDGTFQGETPLRWCYGDMGVAMALLTVGDNLDNRDLQKEAIELGLKCTQRLKAEIPLLADAHFCHGSAGIGHMLGRLFQHSGLNAFKEGALICMEDTLKKALYVEDYITFIADKGDFGNLAIDGLMEGSIGIALSLLAFIDNHEPSWDRCFLLS